MSHDSPQGPRLQESSTIDELRGLTEYHFEYQRLRKFGRSNPQVQDNSFWNAMIKTGADPEGVYLILATLWGKEVGPRPVPNEATWTMGPRMGISCTTLDDGRLVFIGGVHGKVGESDFCVYNDVLVLNPQDLDDFILYGYPMDVFPPTDFHTATLCGMYIYIIGCLGYASHRARTATPIYRLDTTNWSMHNMVTEQSSTNLHKPGWLYKHQAALASDHQTKQIIV